MVYYGQCGLADHIKPSVSVKKNLLPALKKLGMGIEPACADWHNMGDNELNDLAI